MTISANYPTIRPTLMLDFANSAELDPRITFTRSTTANYYDGKTSVLAEQNLLLQSNTFGTTWVTTNGTLGAGVTDPAGSTTAYSLTATASNATVYQTLTLTATPYTISFWIQRVTGTGTINLTLDGTNFTAVTVTGSWVKYTATATPTAASHTIGIQVTTSGDVINIYGAQLENRSSATATNITTTAALNNYIPVLLSAPANQARFDHDPVAGTSLGLLIEQQSTNLLTYSGAIGSTNWSLLNATANLTSDIAPDGTQTATKLVENSASGQHYANEPVTTTAVAVTFSVYAKASERSLIILSIYDSSATERNTTFNLNSGTVGTTGTGITASIMPVGNGWYRCIATVGTSYAGTNQATISSAIVDNQVSYQGNGYSGIYIWGAQLEALAFPTSYIPTTTAAVTRTADSASMTGTNFSSWFNVGQGCFYAEASYLNATNVGQPQLLGTNTSANILYPLAGSPNNWINYDGANNSYAPTTIALNASNKLAFSYGNGQKQTMANGGTGSSLGNYNNVYSSMTALYIGGSISGGQNYKIKKLSYYPIAITSAQLQALTGS